MHKSYPQFVHKPSDIDLNSTYYALFRQANKKIYPQLHFMQYCINKIRAVRICTAIFIAYLCFCRRRQTYRWSIFAYCRRTLREPTLRIPAVF